LLEVKPSFESGCRRCSSAIPRSTSAGISISICTYIKRERRKRDTRRFILSYTINTLKRERERRVEGERASEREREQERVESRETERAKKGAGEKERASERAREREREYVREREQ
jgi:hypothetical protein